MKNSIYIICLSIITTILVLNIGINAQELKPGETSVRFKSGVTVVFRSETEPPQSGKYSTGVVSIKSGSNVINRIFVDEERGIYYGYDVEVEPAAQPGQFKITIKQLSASPSVPTENFLREPKGRSFGRGEKQPPPVTTGTELTALPLPKYPEPQLLEIDDTLALDVLVNRQTGVKVIDLIRLQASEVEEAAPVKAPAASKGGDTVSDFTINELEMRMVSSRLTVNKEIIFGGDSNSRMGVSGALIWFYLPEKGRFILSLSPREGFEFQKTGIIENNRIIFTINGDTYEWASNLPIIANMNGRWNLWVLHEPRIRANFRFGQADSFLIGAIDPEALNQKKK